MTKHQQTRLATLIGHRASLVLPFVLLISTFPAALVSSCPPPHPGQNFLQRRVEGGIRDGTLAIKGAAFTVDLRRDLNVPSCRLHSLQGGAGNPNECLFCLIHCQKQSQQ